jgi:hypothetical protein
MIRSFSDWLYRCTNRFTIWPIAILFLLHVFVILPSESNVDRIVGTFGGILQYFRYFIYSPDDFYAVLEGIGPEGRAEFIDHRIIKANIFIFSIGSFFTICTGALLRFGTAKESRLRILNVMGFIPAFCDVIENHTQMVLVAMYPQRFDAVVVVITSFTAIKWVTLLLSMLIFFFAVGAATVALFRRRR